jgi:hypothetical protein
VKIMPGNPAQSKIPQRYQDSGTSGLEVDVPVDQDKIQFDVVVTTQ